MLYNKVSNDLTQTLTLKIKMSWPGSNLLQLSWQTYVELDAHFIPHWQRSDSANTLQSMWIWSWKETQVTFLSKWCAVHVTRYILNYTNVSLSYTSAFTTQTMFELCFISTTSKLPQSHNLSLFIIIPIQSKFCTSMLFFFSMFSVSAVHRLITISRFLNHFSVSALAERIVSTIKLKSLKRKKTE